MKSTVLSRIGLLAGATVTAATVATSPAAAITYGYGPWYNGSQRGAVAYFEKHGDHFKVCDTKSDGRYATIYVYDETAKRYQMSLSDTKNDGKCHYSSAADGGYFNLPENHWFQITVRVVPDYGNGYGEESYEIVNNA
ncbi:hypothetical protein [Streptomyces sp. NPDC054834]